MSKEIMIKNIIFDLGNVILYDRPASVLNNISISSKDCKIIEDSFFKDFTELDLGNITLEEHLNNCGLDSVLSEKFREILLNYYKYRIFNDDIIDLMNTLKTNGYGIYIFSNNNKETSEYLKGLPMFEYVDGWLFSCDYHIGKPNKEIYYKLFEIYSLNPAECFFVDDSKKNIEEAKKLGMNGYVLNLQKEGIEALIADMKNHNIKC